MIENLSPHQQRPITPLGVWESTGFAMKVYGIAYNRPGPRVELIEAARAIAGEYLLLPTTQRTHGVGFIGIHDGRGENQIFIDRWINENEVLHHVWVSRIETPADVHPAPYDFNSVCIWDLKVQCHEREAWMRHVLDNPNGQDFEGYMADTLSGMF